MIQFTQYQNKIPLPTRRPRSENLAVIAGWGLTENSYGYLTSPHLKKGPAIILNSTDCAQHVPLDVLNTQFCTFYSIGKGICAGDGGGSVVSNGELYGVISFSYGCAQGTPDVHTAVYYYLDFIRTHMIE
ncbi:PREDICTED: trypsin-2-like [Ceratosolen solmsi marchali]|nr:PREDICTED: trypsin-2-like [Ceratosolen solmsi marchali]